jgi:K+-transporting ATPase ATPase C chain
MLAHLRANLWLLVLTVLLCSVLYPLVLLGIGQTVFHDNAQGSLLADAQKHVVGSRLIGQPFTRDEYFWPRPSAAGSGNGYNAAASGASNWAGSNRLLRDRVARQLGPIVTYRSDGPKKGPTVGPDIETWFHKDEFKGDAESVAAVAKWAKLHPAFARSWVDGKPGIVAQWAILYPTLAQNWIKADMTPDGKYGPCGDYVTEWKDSHKEEVAQWINDPDTPEPKPEDLAVPFFVSYSKVHPGTFPSPVAHKTADGKTEKRIEPVEKASDIQTDIQSNFFDMWLQQHPDADLEPVPADMVMASGSGLDPHITLDNAHWQMDRVVGARANQSKASEDAVRKKIEEILRQHSTAPLGGLVGIPLVNVLEVNRALDEFYGKVPQ